MDSQVPLGRCLRGVVATARLEANATYDTGIVLFSVRLDPEGATIV